MEGQSKTILGGPMEAKGIVDNGVPGPGHYNLKNYDHIPGVRIVARKIDDESVSDETLERAQGIGP